MRKFLAHESHWEFVLEAFVFALLLGLCAWPILSAAEAIQKVL